MRFSAKIKQEVLVRSARHCCVCHKPKGLNIEVHHINPKKQGGKDTIQNAIALCFDCHADAGHYFAGHPKGIKLSPKELQKHKTEWFKIVKENKILEPKGVFVELTILDKNFKGKLQPIFIRQTTRYMNRDMFKKIYELLGKDPMEFVNEMKEKYKDIFIDPYLKKVKTYDDYIDYLNGNHIKNNDEEPDISCQPILHRFGPFNTYKRINKSNCILNLKLTNYGPEVLEDYKLYLNFENVVNADPVSKRTSVFDSNEYDYNVTFFEADKGEFIPERNVLVQNDSVFLDPICFRPKFKATDVTINWELFARNVRIAGSVKIVMKAKFEKTETAKYVDNSDNMKNIIQILPKIEIA